MTSEPGATQTDLEEPAFLLPAYIVRREHGVFVNLARFPVGREFEHYVDNLFSSAVRFAGLDYECFLGLLYDEDARHVASGKPAEVRLAADIVPFPPQRQALYKAVKISPDGARAEYFFEPAFIEVVSEEPVYGEEDSEGNVPIVDYLRKVELQPTKLDLDEFVADMWLKGVRFGIKANAVRKMMECGATERMEFAVRLEPTDSRDAEIEEACSALRRDNSPQILPNGKADLGRFKNRFPQIGRGARLLKKIPRVLGKPGYLVTGEAIEPEIPQDIDLHALAGIGTSVETQAGYEFIVSSRDGFVNLDPHSNQISVTEKIVNKSGISLRTTGDLALSGAEFVEHGEVQEGRVVQGKNMTFLSDVYGNIISQNGNIQVAQNLSGGRAESIGGDVAVQERALNAWIEAWDGEVTVKYAESCIILGRFVAVEHAVNCQIVAEQIQIGISEGCGMAGESIRIAASNSSRGKETIISILVPDIALLDAQIEQANKEIAEIRREDEVKLKALNQFKSEPELAKYLMLEASILQGEVKLIPAQQENWNRMTAKFSQKLFDLKKLEKGRQAPLQKLQALEQEMERLRLARKGGGKVLSCDIDKVVGDTLAQTLAANVGITMFQKLSGTLLRTKLHNHAEPKRRIFSGHQGSLAWRYQAPQSPDAGAA